MRDQWQVFDLRLGDKQAAERIVMVERQRLNPPGVRRADLQNLMPQPLDPFGQIRRRLKISKALLDRDLPEIHDTDHDLRDLISEDSPRLSAKPRRLLE